MRTPPSICTSPVVLVTDLAKPPSPLLACAPSARRVLREDRCRVINVTVAAFTSAHSHILSVAPRVASGAMRREFVSADTSRVGAMCSFAAVF